jgi:hypothetical protein
MFTKTSPVAALPWLISRLMTLISFSGAAA